MTILTSICNLHSRRDTNHKFVSRQMLSIRDHYEWVHLLLLPHGSELPCSA